MIVIYGCCSSLSREAHETHCVCQVNVVRTCSRYMSCNMDGAAAAGRERPEEVLCLLRQNFILLRSSLIIFFQVSREQQSSNLSVRSTFVASKRAASSERWMYVYMCIDSINNWEVLRSENVPRVN
jgi:hypothetical protein